MLKIKAFKKQVDAKGCAVIRLRRVLELNKTFRPGAKPEYPLP